MQRPSQCLNISCMHFVMFAFHVYFIHFRNHFGDAVLALQEKEYLKTFAIFGPWVPFAPFLAMASFNANVFVQRTMDVGQLSEDAICPDGVCAFWFQGKGCRSLPLLGGSCSKDHPEAYNDKNLCLKARARKAELRCSGQNCWRIHLDDKDQPWAGQNMYDQLAAQAGKDKWGKYSWTTDETAADDDHAARQPGPAASSSWDQQLPAELDQRVPATPPAPTATPKSWLAEPDLLDFCDTMPPARYLSPPAHELPNAKYIQKRVEEHDNKNGTAIDVYGITFMRMEMNPPLSAWVLMMKHNPDPDELDKFKAGNHVWSNVFATTVDRNGFKTLSQFLGIVGNDKAPIPTEFTLNKNGELHTFHTAKTYLRGPILHSLADIDIMPSPEQQSTEAIPVPAERGQQKSNVYDNLAGPPTKAAPTPAQVPFKAPPAVPTPQPPTGYASANTAVHSLMQIVEKAWPRSVGLRAWEFSGDRCMHNLCPPVPPGPENRPHRPVFGTPAEFFHALDRMQSLELERRALILASSLVNAMDFDFLSADQDGRDALINIWTDSWLKSGPDWAMCNRSGRHTANQIQFVSRYIEISTYMNDPATRRSMFVQSNIAASAAQVP